MTKSTIYIPLLTLVLGLVLGYTFFGESQKQEYELVTAANCSSEGRSVVWSCAMHPQVKLAEEGHCPFCGMALSTSVSRAYDDPLKVTMSEAAAQLAGIQTQKVGAQKTIIHSLSLDGQIVVDESRVHNQVAHLPGRIDRLYVNKPGMYVKKGQPIASVYSRELIAVVESFAFNKTTPAVVRSAENNLRSWKVSKEQLSDFDVAKDDYRKAINVYADFSGFVVRQHARQGDLAVNTHMGEPTIYYEIADLSRVWGEFSIYEKDIAKVRVGEVVHFSVPAFRERKFEAKIVELDPLVNTHTRTMTARVEIDNPELLLKPGMLASGTLVVQQATAPDQLAIPKSAVLWTGEESVVYVRDTHFDQPVFEYREVRIEGDAGDQYLISAGLRKGEEVVINGAFRVDASAQLQQKNSMVNRALQRNLSASTDLVEN